MFKKIVEKACLNIITEPPDERDPVRIEVSLIKDTSSDIAAVLMKVNIMNGWHIYSNVPPTHHYINTEFILEIPKGVNKLGTWIKPDSLVSEEEGVYIFEKEAIFIQYIKAGTNDVHEEGIKAGLYYQCCNYSICKPPTEKVYTLKI